jgi:UDP-N-acetylmuramoyl-tripeptide--D-alanyl-D-alanine ligase
MAEPLWTSKEILDATSGRLEGPAFTASGVSIDSRTLAPGDLFVALSETRDGAEFIPAAHAAGAAGALTQRPGEGSRVIVPDTLEALAELGRKARDRANRARRGAITGSVGKTSVTQAVRAGLTLAGAAHGSVSSYNNHIGVPLTLARMPKTTERAIFEIGMNHAGEIAPLSRMVAPHAVAITNVGAVHVENFADGEAGIAAAKAEIFSGLGKDGIAILNADNCWFEALKDRARRAGARVRSFGSPPDCDARLTGFSAQPTGALVEAVIDGAAVSFSLRQAGAHWGLMSLCALMMLQALDVDLALGMQGLAAFAPLAGRGAERAIALPGGEAILVDESYNANPISVAAALDTLGARRVRGRRIVALTDMLELGSDGARYHAALASPLEAARIDLVFCAGPLMKSLWEALPTTRRGGYARRAADLIPLLARAVEPGDVVMVKGSRDSQAKLVAQAMAELGAAAPEDA